MSLDLFSRGHVRISVPVNLCSRNNLCHFQVELVAVGCHRGVHGILFVGFLRRVDFGLLSADVNTQNQRGEVSAKDAGDRLPVFQRRLGHRFIDLFRSATS